MLVERRVGVWCDVIDTMGWCTVSVSLLFLLLLYQLSIDSFLLRSSVSSVLASERGIGGSE